MAVSKRGKPPVRLRNPRRVASAGIRGFHYQFSQAAARWLKCKPGDVLICEGNEDIDLIKATGEVEEIQIKHESGTLRPGSRGLRKTLAGFALAFCEHDAKGQRCFLAFVTSAKANRKSGALLASWLLGAKVSDFEQLAVEAASKLKLPSEATNYLTVNNRWKKFLKSVVIQTGAPNLDEYAHKLRAQVVADVRMAGLDPDHVVAAMTHRILVCSGKPDLAQRTLTALDLDLLLNDLWLAAGVTEYDAIEGPREAYVAMNSSAPRGRACVAVFLDDRTAAIRAYQRSCQDRAARPDGATVNSLSELCGQDLSFINGLSFDAYAVLDTRTDGSSSGELVAELVPYVSAREAPSVHILGEALRTTVESVPENFPFQTRRVDPDELGAALALLIGEAIITSFSERKATAVLKSVFRKVRVVCDVGAGAYFTQASPPAWVS